jgi:hypothetical protein
MTDHPQKITLGEMSDIGVRGILVFCADYQCSHSIAISADHWPDDVSLSDIEPRFCLPSLRQAWRMWSYVLAEARFDVVEWVV